MRKRKDQCTSIDEISRNTKEMNQNIKDMKVAAQKREEKENTPVRRILGAVLTLLTAAAAVATIIAAIPHEAKKDEQELYVYSEYAQLRVGAETNIIVNFSDGQETKKVSITAYLDSVKNGDTVQMSQINSDEWKCRVFFEETGIFEIIATAVMSDGTQIEGSTEIEVIQ